MGEVVWGITTSEIQLIPGRILSQSFSPLWSHTLETLRWRLRSAPTPAVYRVSIQYLKPDGTPTGVDLVTIEHSCSWALDGWALRMCQEKVPPIPLVMGIEYAFVIQLLWGIAPTFPWTSICPIPGYYTRGHLIRSNDYGSTWDMTDIGNLHFAEFGDPPIHESPYRAPAENYAITWLGQIDYNTNVCFRIATTNPVTLRCFFTDEEPTLIEKLKSRRGSEILCFDHYRFISKRTYVQKEKDDSIYHTFFLDKLKTGQKYWLCFDAKVNFNQAPSSAPIFARVHPEAPPFTTMRRPDAPGDLCTINQQVGDPCPNHYLNINEASPDEDTTCIWALLGGTTGWRKDLYKIPDLIANDRPIRQVHITARCRRYGGMYYAAKFKMIGKTNGVIFESGIINCPDWQYNNFHMHYYDNPVTGLPWTFEEVNNLQIGVNLKWYWGVGWVTTVRCTQVYCKIYHACEAYQ